jgi:hypothetical protein
MRTTKKNIDYFIHKTRAYRDGKFKKLRRDRSWGDEAKFWALNCIIAEQSECWLDLSLDYDKMEAAEAVEMTEQEFDEFVIYLKDKVDLIVRDGDKITTEIVQENLGKVTEKRERNREYYEARKKPKENKSPKTLEEKKKELQKRREKFKKSLEPFLKNYSRTMLNAFYSYWTEPNKSYSKLKWEMQKTWDLSRRLSSWANREPVAKKSGQAETPKTGKTETVNFTY